MTSLLSTRIADVTARRAALMILQRVRGRDGGCGSGCCGGDPTTGSQVTGNYFLG